MRKIKGGDVSLLFCPKDCLRKSRKEDGSISQIHLDPF